jgi:hypothetical protein
MTAPAGTSVNGSGNLRSVTWAKDAFDPAVRVFSLPKFVLGLPLSTNVSADA